VTSADRPDLRPHSPLSHGQVRWLIQIDYGSKDAPGGHTMQWCLSIQPPFQAKWPMSALGIVRLGDAPHVPALALAVAVRNAG
jgi:hypothetical protein